MNDRSMPYAAASALAVMAASPAFATASEESAASADERAQEIVVTATPLGQSAQEVATPVTVLEGDSLNFRRRATIGETLAEEPGISVDTFGAGATRPVIRGQTSPRIRILSDSSEIQDASQVSPDHATVSEPLLLRRIEVLRGPSALLYGGGAISGAVNLIDSKIPEAAPGRIVGGAGEFRYGTADNERAAVAGITIGAGPFALRAEGVYRDADDYRAPDRPERRVHGTFHETRTGTVGVSWVGADGFLGIAYTRHRSDYGVPGHSHDYESCHPHGTSLHCGGHGHDDDDHDHGDDDHAHEDAVAIDLRSNRFDIRGEYRDPFAGIERVRLRAGFTSYRHLEFHLEEDGHGDHDHDHDHDHEDGHEDTLFTNKSRDLRLELEHAPILGLRGVIGFQHARSRFNTIGGEAFIPENVTRSTGIFLFESLDAGPVRIEVAARQEWQRIATTLDRERQFSPFSISGAAVWRFSPGYSAALAVSRSRRAPTAQELFARGIHLGTNTFEIGSPDLGSETARTIDLTIRKTEGDTRFTFALFRNRIDDYIFANTLDRFEEFRLIRYEQRDARFTGVEGSIRHRFTPEFGLALFGDHVRAKFRRGGENLPRIPAGRLGARADFSRGPVLGELEYYRVFAQGRIADFETRTPGYDMVNATLAYRVRFGAFANGEIFVRGTNLLNALALNHSSFVRDAAPLRGRNLVLGIRTSF